MPQTAPIILPIETPGLNDLQKLQKRMKALEDTVEKLNKDLVKNASATKKAGRAAATASGNVQRLGIAFRTTLAPITAIVGGLALLSKALNTTGSRGAELNVISTSLRGLVDDSEAAANALLGVADKLGKATLFDEEDFTATFKLFTSFRNIGVDAYERVAEAAADIATKLGTGPKEAALQLAKALEDPAKQVTALARSGTVFTEQQKEQIKALQASGDLLGAQEIILKEIEAQYGGAAKAAGAAGFAGALDSLGESWRDFLEVLGQSSENGAVEFLNAIARGLDFVKENFDVISAAASAVVDVLVQPFVAIVEGIQSVTDPIDNFREQFRGTLAIITKLLTDLTNNVLKPVFKVVGQIVGGIIKLLAGLLTAIGNFSVKAVEAIVGALRKIADAVEMFINSTPAGILSKLFGIDAGAAAGNGIRTLANGLESLAAGAKEYATELLAAADAANQLADAEPANNINPFKGAGPKGAINQPGSKGSKGGGGADKAAAKAAREAEKAQKALNKLYKDALNTGLQRTANLFDQLRSLDDQKRILEAKLNGNENEVRLAIQVRDATADLPPEIAKVVEERIRSINALEQEVEESEKLKNELTESQEVLKSTGDIIAGELTSGIEGLIKGTATWGDMLSNILSQLGSMFISAGIGGLGTPGQAGSGSGLLGAIFNGKAKGGPINANSPYLVGEEGPELIVPSSGGTVIPNDYFSAAASALSGAGTGDADDDALGLASGPGYSGASGAAAFAAARGAMAGSAAQQQQRVASDALTASNPFVNGTSENPKITYESQIINSVEYVSVAQAQAMSDQAAKRGAQMGEARTMGSLRNKPASRKRAGVG